MKAEHAAGNTRATITDTTVWVTCPDTAITWDGTRPSSMAMNPDIAQLGTSEGFYPMKCTGASCHYEIKQGYRFQRKEPGQRSGYSDWLLHILTPHTRQYEEKRVKWCRGSM